MSLSSVPDSPTHPIIKHTWNKEVIVLSPTVQQWEEYPALLDFAFNRDYHSVGVYLVNVPESLRQTLVPIAKPKSSSKCASYEVIPCANGLYQVMSAAAMLISIWNLLMMKIQTRCTKMHMTTRITNHALEYLTEQIGEAVKYTAVNSSSNIVMVQASNMDSHIVKLNEGTCTCLEFQDRKLPCQHAI